MIKYRLFRRQKRQNEARKYANNNFRAFLNDNFQHLSFGGPKAALSRVISKNHVKVTKSIATSPSWELGITS